MAITATQTQIPINLTHNQLMALGWSAQCKEYVQDGDLFPLRLCENDKRTRNALVRKGLAYVVTGTWVDFFGKVYPTTDYALTEKGEFYAKSAREYYLAHETPELGPLALTPKEWESVAG